jgi:SpoVK/Ycf46/Vps4 family AAA+-type ATPase
LKGQKIKSFELEQLHTAVKQTKEYFFAIDNLLNELGG